MYRIISLFLFLLNISVHLFGQDSIKSAYKYSNIVSVPDLSFFKQVYSGLDILQQMDFSPLKNKSIAILTNQTAINKNGEHILDIIKNVKDVKVSFIFSFEHGLWEIEDNRSKLIGRDNIDPIHNAPIIDLFNTYIYPPHWVMEKIDLILVDFQDTGSRYSTYISTLSKVFESSSDHKIPVMILDRPNPIRGDIIDGPIPRVEFQSFESYHLFPIRHGLTIGEMALIIN